MDHLMPKSFLFIPTKVCLWLHYELMKCQGAVFLLGDTVPLVPQMSSWDDANTMNHGSSIAGFFKISESLSLNFYCVALC